MRFNGKVATTLIAAMAAFYFLGQGFVGWCAAFLVAFVVPEIPSAISAFYRWWVA